MMSLRDQNNLLDDGQPCPDGNPEDGYYCLLCSGERCEPCFIAGCAACDCDVVMRHHREPCKNPGHAHAEERTR